MNIFFKNVANWCNYQQVIYSVDMLSKEGIFDGIIDLGCGDGDLTGRIMRKMKSSSFFGIDNSSYRIKKAKKRGIIVYKRDLNNRFSIRGKKFNAVISLQTIEHLQDLDNYFDEITKLLKPNGTVIIATENLASWHNIAALFFGQQPFTGPYLSKKFLIGWHPLTNRKDVMKTTEYDKKGMSPHINVMTTSALKELLKKNDFMIKDVSGLGYYPFPVFVGKILSKIDPYHSIYCIITATKK